MCSFQTNTAHFYIPLARIELLILLPLEHISSISFVCVWSLLLGIGNPFQTW